MASHYAAGVGRAAVEAGLPESSVGALVQALDSGKLATADIPGANPAILAAANEASKWEYAHAYRLAWSSIIPFVVLAIIAVWLLKSMKHLMTEKVEATVERVQSEDGKNIGDGAA